MSDSNPSHKGKILVVDDDRLVLATVTHGLSQAGFEVIDADNGDDAILLARKHRPDLALRCRGFVFDRHHWRLGRRRGSHGRGCGRRCRRSGRHGGGLAGTRHADENNLLHA